jgi:hypothetical protein
VSITIVVLGLMLAAGTTIGLSFLRATIEKSNDRYREGLRDDIRQLEVMTKLLECMCKPEDTEARAIIDSTNAYIADVRKLWKL